jgi:hypothetical protein
MRRRSLRSASLVAALAGLHAAAAQAADLVFTGQARAIESREPLYVESHSVRAYGTADEERVVLYRCTNGGAPFARKTLRYSVNREEPEFELEDARLGYVEGLRRVGGAYEVFLRSGRDVTERRKTLTGRASIVSDAGFDELVKKHWAELEAGRTVRFAFLVPSRLDYLTFKVRKHREERIEGEAASVIRLNLSGVLGFFLPYIEVSYRKSDRVLMRYKGLTNIRDLEGDNVTALIEFPSSERRAQAVDLAALRAAPLVTRCP